MPTINNGLEVLMQEIKDFLYKGLSSEVQNSKALIRYYWEASNKAERLIMATVGEAGVRFPIDVEVIAEKLGIPVEEEDLNEFISRKSMNRKIGQIVIDQDDFSENQTKTRTIFTDKAAAPSSKRYAIAHEIVHFIMHYDKAEYYEDYCIMPMCPRDAEEIVADIFAIFLLIPVRLFFVEFKDYVQRQMTEERTPVTTENWIRFLAERSMLSEYYVAYGYQQLRYVAYWIYQAWKDDEKNEAVKMDEEERERIQKATEDYFNDEIADLLFQ